MLIYQDRYKSAEAKRLCGSQRRGLKPITTAKIIAAPLTVKNKKFLHDLGFKVMQ